MGNIECNIIRKRKFLQPPKFIIYNLLLMQFTHTQKEFIKNFQIKNSGKNHDFYGQSDTLLSADEFEDLQNMS